ncbi:MAG: phosphatase PAP2 family protein [Bryobacteraceae bacterium]
MKRHHYDLLYKFCTSLAVVLVLLVVMAIWHLGSNSMIACGFTGAFFFHVGSRPKSEHLLWAVATGAGYGTAYALLGTSFGGSALQAATGIGAFLGLGSLTIMSLAMVWTDSRAYVEPLRRALVLPVFSLIAGISMDAVTKARPPAYDFYLYAFDSGLGLTPGASVVKLFDALPWLQMAASVIYALLLLFPTLYDAWGLRLGQRSSLMTAFAVGGVCGFIFYQICPGLGPVYVFGSRFPAHLPDPGEFQLAMYHGAGARNAMPSMHMTWALLVWWSAWELTPLARWIATVFATLTFFATLGFGEHYLVDLIVAVPFALLIEAICALRSERKAALQAGAVALAFTLSWLLMLRTTAVAHMPIWAGWAMVVGTIAVTVPIQFALRRRLRTTLRRAQLFDLAGELKLGPAPALR